MGVYGAEYSVMPRFHSSSVWFFLIALRETDMAIATDVGETEGAMDSAPVRVFTFSFAFNFVRK